MKVSDQQRRAVLAAGLSVRTGEGVIGAVERVVGLHSSDPATVYLSLRARVPDFTVGALDAELYESRQLIRLLGMRRTMFVVPDRMAPVIHHSTTAALVAAERRRTWTLVEKAGVSKDGRTWVEEVARRTLAVLSSGGPATARELRSHVPELTETLTIHKKDGSVAGTSGASTRILFLLATEGKIVRARPRGTWLSSQYEWATYERWTGHPLGEVAPVEAQNELMRQWLTAFGPGTERDIKWWTGWPLGKVRASLDSVGATQVNTSGGPGFVLPEFEPPGPIEGSAVFLPGLDPSIMAWKQRDWYLGEHGTHLFDRNGNAGPTIVVDGQVVGGWGQRPNGEVVYRLLQDVGSEGKKSVEKEAGNLQRWLGGIVVTPRFRTPLERSLSSPT